MAHQPWGEAALLGVVQGITEFLPISSDGHLALGTLLFGVEGGGLTLNVLLHAGTLLATLLVFRRQVGPLARAGLRALVAPREVLGTPAGRDLAVVVLSALPTGVIGLALRDAVERWTTAPLVVGLGFLTTAAFLLSTRFAPEGQRELPGWLGVLLIGVCQGLAVLPGLSRSGSTIAVALWLGVRRDRAFDLSMMMSVPPVLGAVLLELRHALKEHAPLGPAVLGAVVAFGVGWVALLLLRRVVVRGWFHLFSLWVIPLGFATLAMAQAWP